MAMTRGRVGIVTINDDANYGNRLQNLALQEVIRSLGWEAETLRNHPPAWDRALLVPRIVHDVRNDASGLSRRAMARVKERLGGPSPSVPRFSHLRRQAIGEFARTHVQSSPHRFSERPPAYWAERYTCAVAGSDQVWNPTYRRAQGIDFLEFIGRRHRIAYAASFGVARIPSFLQGRYRGWLKAIPHLSVRESAGGRIVAELTGREVPVVLDPTLTIGRSVWDRLVADAAPVAADGYAVRFFLGSTTPAQEAWLERDAHERGVDVIDLHDLGAEAYADAGPAEFIAAISRADVVYTDSFHAGIFSLLFRRAIVLRERFEGDPRWRELLAQHALSTRHTGVAGLHVVAEPDWETVDARREGLRQASLAFLHEALDASAERAD